MMQWPALVALSLLVFGCSPAKVEPVAAERAAPPVEKTVTRTEAIASLPCFQCHAFKKFSAPPEKGVFSHRLHLDSGYHCNQCHRFEGHRHITVQRTVCGACHSVKTLVFNKGALPVRYNHEAHAKRFGCRECHPGLFLMKAGTAEVTMKEIYNGAYCGACHDGARAFPATECAKCHPSIKGFSKELTYKVEGVGNVTYSHKFHTALFSCDECHPKLFSMKKTQGKMKMDPMYAGKLCGTCHNGSTAFPVTDCEKCHKN